MNMENFITGYPGHEHQVRAELKARLGQEKYEFFFDKVSLRARYVVFLYEPRRSLFPLTSSSSSISGLKKTPNCTLPSV